VKNHCITRAVGIGKTYYYCRQRVGQNDNQCDFRPKDSKPTVVCSHMADESGARGICTDQAARQAADGGK